jgi:hypothetical protein
MDDGGGVDTRLRRTLMGMHITGVHLMAVHLTGVYLTGMHLMGVWVRSAHLTCVHLMGVHLTALHLMGVGRVARGTGSRDRNGERGTGSLGWSRCTAAVNLRMRDRSRGADDNTGGAGTWSRWAGIGWRRTGKRTTVAGRYAISWIYSS